MYCRVKQIGYSALLQKTCKIRVFQNPVYACIAEVQISEHLIVPMIAWLCWCNVCYVLG